MFHSWDEDNDRMEALGLRKLLREAVSPEDYALATTKRCIQLGEAEHARLAEENQKRWFQTFKDLKARLGRNPTAEEHRAELDKNHG